MIKQVVVEVEKYALSVLNTIFPVPVPINCCVQLEGGEL